VYQKVGIRTSDRRSVNWSAAVSQDAPWIALSATSGATPAQIDLGLVNWRAEGQPAGNYTGKVTVTVEGLAPVTLDVIWTVVARLPAPKVSYISGPKGCTQPEGYIDPALCTVPDEKPPGTFNPPPPGSSYIDPNFGASVKIMTGTNVYHTYSSNNPLSANNRFLMTFLSNGSFDVIDAATGRVAYPKVRSNQDFFWDSYQDSIYYYPAGAAFIKHDLSDGKESTVVDYAKDGHHFTSIKRGATTGSSSDNWIAFYAPNEQQICTLDLNNVQTYCADYNHGPKIPFGQVDYTMDSKGVDRATGKRYVILVAGVAGIYSVNMAAGRLDLEFQGPEDLERNGNRDGICDPGEHCMNASHSDTFQDSAGTQYLVFNTQTESPCEVSTATYQLNKGLSILQAAELGGGKRKILSLWRCPFPNGNGGTDEHIGCAKRAPFCVISTIAPYRAAEDPPLRFPHATEIMVMRDNGLEVRRLAESRSVRFKEEGDSAYWAEPRAAISDDGSLVVADSNFGELHGVRVTVMATGFGKTQPAGGEAEVPAPKPAATPAATHASVRAWEDSIALPTWQEGFPEEAPSFDYLSPGRGWYPYATRSRLLKERREEQWRTLNLENEYLVCSILPDLGGHLYGCRDKLSGYEMFYNNPSIKKSMVGLRGAWAALGMELNFPVAHSLETVSPVDFGVAQESGSASVWVGSTDRVTGMRWVVRFSLEAGASRLRQDVTLSNPGSVRNRYQWWSNAGVTLEKDTRFIVPTRVIATHGATHLDTWPVNTAGVDRSVVANYPGSIGLFAYGSREPFHAIFHPASRTGTVHYADPAAVPGKKIWTWGKADDQRIRGELSDNHTTYVELQAGLMENQETFAFLEPWQARTFTEYWMPVRGMSGITQAGPDGIMNLDRRPSGLVAQFLPAHRIAGAKLRISQGDTVVVDEAAELTPANPFDRTVKEPRPGAYTLELRDSGGKVLLAYTENEYSGVLPNTVRLGPQTQRDWSKAATEQELVERAEYNQLQGQLQFAANDYAKGLDLFPSSVPLLKGSGRLAVRTRRYTDAGQVFAALAKLGGMDAEAHYYLGLAMAGTGHADEARAEWLLAEPDGGFGSAATLELAAAYSRQREFERALNEMDKVLATHPDLERAWVADAAVLRRAGQAAAAATVLERALALDPIDSLARFEGLREGKADEALWEHLGADPERVLEVADFFMHWGLYADALQVLARTYPAAPANRSEPGSRLPQDHALVSYYRGWCRQQLGEDAGADYQKAAAQPTRYVFPNRASSATVLEEAVKRNPADASAHYLLGLMKMDSGLGKEALAEWETALKLRSGFGDASRLIAVVRPVVLKMEGAPAGAGRTPSTAPKAASRGAAPAVRSGEAPNEIAQAALMKAANGDLGAALGLFNSTNFPKPKQPDDVRAAYIELQLQRLLALRDKKDCDSVDRALANFDGEDKGLPFTFDGFGGFTKGVRFQYLYGTVVSSCHSQRWGRKQWEKLAKTPVDLSSPEFAYPIFALASVNLDEAAKRAEGALEQIRLQLEAQGSDRGALLYSQGLLYWLLGKRDQAAVSFRDGAEASEGVVQYLNTDAMVKLYGGFK